MNPPSTARLRGRGRAAEEYARRSSDDDLELLLAPTIEPEADDPPQPPPQSHRRAGASDGVSGRSAARSRAETDPNPSDLSQFTPRERIRGLSAALPANLDVVLAAFERDEARAGRRRTRIAIVEEAVAALPDAPAKLRQLLAEVAPSLHPDVPARAFSVRVRPEVVDRLEDLALGLYTEFGLRKVTNRALAVAALVHYLGDDARQAVRGHAESDLVEETA